MILYLLCLLMKPSRSSLRLKGQISLLYFDGTTRLGEALAIVVRFVVEWRIEQRLIRLQLLVKSMTGEQIAREIINTLSVEYGISVDRVLACMRDRASTNQVAVRTMKILYPNILDVGCFSHTIDNAGGHIQTPTLEEFIKLWISLFSHSPRARLEWKELTGKAMASYSVTRWWSRWEVCNQVLCQFGDVLPFLQSHPEMSPATTGKLLQLLSDPQRNAFLRVELAALIDCGESFVKATYNLEGDGPLVFKCHEILTTLTARIHTDHYPNLGAVARALCGGTGGSPSAVQQWVQYGKSCVKPGLDYFLSKFNHDLSSSVSAFKAAKLFVPSKIVEMKPTAAEVDSLKAFPFLDCAVLLRNLKAELGIYLAKAADVSPETDTLLWWQNHSTYLPYWSSALKDVLLVQPSSAAAERVFSLLKASFGPQQDSSLQDYVQSALMLQYNRS